MNQTVEASTKCLGESLVLGSLLSGKEAVEVLVAHIYEEECKLCSAEIERLELSAEKVKGIGHFVDQPGKEWSDEKRKKIHTLLKKHKEFVGIFSEYDKDLSSIIEGFNPARGAFWDHLICKLKEGHGGVMNMLMAGKYGVQQLCLHLGSCPDCDKEAGKLLEKAGIGRKGEKAANKISEVSRIFDMQGGDWSETNKQTVLTLLDVSKYLKPSGKLDETQSEDMKQGFSQKLLKSKLDNFDPKIACFRNYLNSQLGFHKKDAYKKQKTLKKREVSDETQTDNKDGEAITIKVSDLSHQHDPRKVRDNALAIEQCLSRLAKKEVEIVEKFYFDGLLVKEISTEIGESESNIKIILHRARQKMFEWLAPIQKLNYENLKNNPREFLAVTGTDQEEFQQLLPPFKKSYTKLATKIKEEDPLDSFEDKLLFAVAREKSYPARTKPTVKDARILLLLLRLIGGRVFGYSDKGCLVTWLYVSVYLIKKNMENFDRTPEFGLQFGLEHNKTKEYIEKLMPVLEQVRGQNKTGDGCKI